MAALRSKRLLRASSSDSSLEVLSGVNGRDGGWSRGAGDDEICGGWYSSKSEADELGICAGEGEEENVAKTGGGGASAGAGADGAGVGGVAMGASVAIPSFGAVGGVLLSGALLKTAERFAKVVGLAALGAGDEEEAAVEEDGSLGGPELTRVRFIVPLLGALPAPPRWPPPLPIAAPLVPRPRSSPLIGLTAIPLPLPRGVVGVCACPCGGPTPPPPPPPPAPPEPEGSMICPTGAHWRRSE